MAKPVLILTTKQRKSYTISYISKLFLLLQVLSFDSSSAGLVLLTGQLADGEHVDFTVVVQYIVAIIVFKFECCKHSFSVTKLHTSNLSHSVPHIIFQSVLHTSCFSHRIAHFIFQSQSCIHSVAQLLAQCCTCHNSDKVLHTSYYSHSLTQFIMALLIFNIVFNIWYFKNIF